MNGRPAFPAAKAMAMKHDTSSDQCGSLGLAACGNGKLPDGAEPGDDAAKPLDRAVMTALAENHRAFLKFFAHRLGSRADAEDAMQDFHLKVLQYSARRRSEANVVAWLRRILHTTLIDQFRQRTQDDKARAAFKEMRAEAAGGAGEELHSVACHCIYLLLPTLKPDYADLIWRAYLMDQTRAQIAHELGLSPNTVAVRLHRARQAIRRRLLESCVTCPVHGFMDCGCPYLEPKPRPGAARGEV